MNQRVWYFAYGSNLNILQMMGKVGEWIMSKRAHAGGYNLVFNVDSKRWGGPAANMNRTGITADLVSGVNYLLSRAKLDVLTEYEGIQPTQIEVRTEGEPNPMRAMTYLWEKNEVSQTPPVAYAKTILQGLRQHGYSDDVIRTVTSLMSL